MKLKRQAVQEELFGLSENENVKQLVKELDRQIANAVRQKEYQKAKELTEQQEQLLRKMVDPEG